MINKVFNLLKVYLADDFTIAVVLFYMKIILIQLHIFWQKIIEECGESKNLTDGSVCLRKYKTIKSQHNG